TVGRDVAVLAESELRENQRPRAALQLRDGAADHLLRMAGAVNRRGIYPVDAMIERRMNRLDALRIVGAAPHVAAHGPRPQSDPRNVDLPAPKGSSLHEYSSHD